MAVLVTLVGQHVDREPPTVAIQATTEWEAILALVYLQEGGLGVHQHVHVCCYYHRRRKQILSVEAMLCRTKCC